MPQTVSCTKPRSNCTNIIDPRTNCNGLHHEEKLHGPGVCREVGVNDCALPLLFTVELLLVETTLLDLAWVLFIRRLYRGIGIL